MVPRIGSPEKFQLLWHTIRALRRLPALRDPRNSIEWFKFQKANVVPREPRHTCHTLSRFASLGGKAQRIWEILSVPQGGCGETYSLGRVPKIYLSLISVAWTTICFCARQKIPPSYTKSRKANENTIPCTNPELRTLYIKVYSATVSNASLASASGFRT